MDFSFCFLSIISKETKISGGFGSENTLALASMIIDAISYLLDCTCRFRLHNTSSSSRKHGQHGILEKHPSCHKAGTVMLHSARGGVERPLRAGMADGLHEAVICSATQSRLRLSASLDPDRGKSTRHTESPTVCSICGISMQRRGKDSNLYLSFTLCRFGIVRRPSIFLRLSLLYLAFFEFCPS